MIFAVSYFFKSCCSLWNWSSNSFLCLMSEFLREDVAQTDGGWGVSGGRQAVSVSDGSSGSRVLWDPATDGSTARGPSAVSRSFSVLIDQTTECKFTDQSSSSAAKWNFSTEMHSCSKKTFQVWWTLCLLCQVYISQFMTFFKKKKKKSQNVDVIR